MIRCEALIVGGGPAGSSCASRLVAAGRDVLVIDKATFPRDKVCAGWITPAVVRALALDLNAYAAEGLTLQPFTGFRTGAVGGALRTTDFGETVSYGIRRCEFDDYLLRRSGARVLGGTPVATLRRERGEWVVNDRIRAEIVVGAGGHFCPVARHLNPPRGRERVVVAQEIEFPVPASGCLVPAATPDLYFWPDLMGYGWCVRKGDHVNIGAGRLDCDDLPATVRAFAADLARRGILPGGVPGKWKGHAYLLNRTTARQLVADGALLVGDAAGLALAPSGEGILAAVESGLLAAEALIEASDRPSADALAPYADMVARRFETRAERLAGVPAVPSWIVGAAAQVLLRSRWLTRRVLLEDWFLHRRRPQLPWRSDNAPLPAAAAD
jgi:flavin-dependent dehydrogenase